MSASSRRKWASTLHSKWWWRGAFALALTIVAECTSARRCVHGTLVAETPLSALRETRYGTRTEQSELAVYQTAFGRARLRVERSAPQRALLQVTPGRLSGRLYFVTFAGAQQCLGN